MKVKNLCGCCGQSRRPFKVIYKGGRYKRRLLCGNPICQAFDQRVRPSTMLVMGGS